MARKYSYDTIYIALAILLVAAAIASTGVGAFSFTPTRMATLIAESVGAIPTPPMDVLDRNVFIHLRLPRVFLAALAGAVLSVGGTLMQGIFRNPIVEPGLAGTSSGAALGAALIIVFGGGWLTGIAGALAMPLAAFAGGFAATMIVYRISASFGKTSVFTLLLAGIAINAMCAGATGFLSYVARDPQARNITFWSLGTFTTADWTSVSVVALSFAGCFAWIMRTRKSLNALMLGEDDASATGVNTHALILRAIVVNTIMVAAVTAAVGVIAFVGLVVPHILRITRSSDYRFLIPASALLGALIMLVIDTVARLVIAPAELPIGIITAIVGAPVFIWILLRQRQRTT